MTESQESHGFMIKVTLAYERVLRRFLGHIWLLLFAIVLPLLLLGYFASKNVGSGFMPTMDEGGLSSITRANREHPLPRPTVSCARSKRFCKPRRKCKPIRVAPGYSSAVALPRRTRATSSLG